ncbi:MAG TPA: CoA transferase [Stellaceae bacterium]|nr:CoA transferase [Stellaceae bacterium]
MSHGASPGALAGLKVIDLTRVLGGPFCTQILGDHGADIIKVEPPQGDETRGWGPPFKGDAASYFIGINRNKRGIALDLTKPAGREVVYRLLANADVLVENFKTGTLERWGMGYEEVLREKFPRLIHCRVSGFGADGPLGGYPGYDAAVQGMSGLMSLNGEAEGEPLRVGVPVVDMATGLNAVIAILMAVHERAHSGRGQFVEATLYDSAVALLHPYAANWFLSRQAPKRTGNAHPNVSPYDQFHTKTKRIFLAVGNNRQFARFCAEIGRADLADDARFRDNRDRVVNRQILRQEIEGALAAIDGEALTTRLLDRGVPCGVVQDLPDVLTHPHTRHRSMVMEEGEYQGLGAPVKLSRTPASLRRLPPRFGEANRAVLREAGFSDGEIAALIEAGAVLEAPQKASAE